MSAGMPEYRNLTPAQKRAEIARIEANLRTMWHEPSHPDAGAPRRNGREMCALERNTHEALRAMAARTGYEAAHLDVSLESVFHPDMLSEDLEEWGIRCDTIRRFFSYLAADGPETWQILRRLFVIGAHMSIEPFCLLTVRERALMLGDSHGGQHWRMKKICTDPVLRKGGRAVKAAGQKGLRASAAAAAAQKGNCNRSKDRKLKGRKHSVNGHVFVGNKNHN